MTLLPRIFPTFVPPILLTLALLTPPDGRAFPETPPDPARAAGATPLASALAARGEARREIRMNASSPKRIPRRDAFFGLHFDLHPGKGDTSLGADTTEENIERLLDRVRPDFVQYDCKGHAGYTGYPTKVGWPSPGIVKDALAIWRKVTRDRGVGLYIHYSGLWDSVAVEKHPEWARIDAAGRPDSNATSTFGPYVDELLIPQLKEVTSNYDLDGLWVDGECWAAQWDYSPAALAAWREKTGRSEAPKGRNDPFWLEWKQFQRDHFERYLARWVDALHAYNPNLQVTSNWMYTPHAPRPVAVKLDYLSGDYSPMLSVDRARVEARYLASSGMPWDLMAWGFNNPPGLGQVLKTPVHLQQEAAVVLMQGGGFQIYYQPLRSGTVVPQIVETAGRVADFCRERQAASHKSETVPQVALLHSAETHWDRSDAVFSPSGMEELEGALHALLESHYSVDILPEHRLQPKLAEYPVVVIPDAYKLAEDFRAALSRYVRDGGSLLLLGEKAARLFSEDLGVDFIGGPREEQVELETPDGVVNENGAWQPVALKTGAGARVVGMRHPSRDTKRGEGQPAATVIDRGKGRIGAVYGPVAVNYFRSHHPYLRRFIGDRVRELFPDPAVEIDGPPTIDIALRRTAGGRLSVHLLNTANVPHSDRYSHTDFIPPVGPVGVTLRVPERPKRVRWVAGTGSSGERLKWSYDDGKLAVTVPKVGIHGAVVVED